MQPPKPESQTFLYAKLFGGLTVFLIVILIVFNNHLRGNWPMILGGLIAICFFVSMHCLYGTWWENSQYRKLCKEEHLLTIWEYDPDEIPRSGASKLFARLTKKRRPFALISTIGTYVSYKQMYLYVCWTGPNRLHQVDLQEIKGRPHLFFTVDSPHFDRGSRMHSSESARHSILIPQGKEDEAREIVQYFVKNFDLGIFR